MKKMMTVCTLLGWILLNIVPAMADNELPSEIQEQLQHTVITSAAQWEEPGNDTWFALVRTEEGINSLHCFTNRSGIWAEEFSTYEAIPQEENQMDIHISDGAWSFSATQDGEGKYLEGPILIILQYGTDSGSIEQLISFQRLDRGVWNLIALRNYPESARVDIEDDLIIYYENADKAQLRIAGTVPCSFDRDLRYLRLSDIPLAFHQIQGTGK